MFPEEGEIKINRVVIMRLQAASAVPVRGVNTAPACCQNP